MGHIGQNMSHFTFIIPLFFWGTEVLSNPINGPPLTTFQTRKDTPEWPFWGYVTLWALTISVVYATITQTILGVCKLRANRSSCKNCYKPTYRKKEEKRHKEGDKTFDGIYRSTTMGSSVRSWSDQKDQKRNKAVGKQPAENVVPDRVTTIF